MSGKYLLDTNIVIALFANDPSVIQALEKEVEVFVPSIVFGELYYGAHGSSRIDENIARIQEFQIDSIVLNCDASTAAVYGEVKNNLKRKGRPIPENDIWIASLALQHDLTLISRDEHFRYIDRLVLLEW